MSESIAPEPTIVDKKKNKFTIENAAMLSIDRQQGTIKLARNLSLKKYSSNLCRNRSGETGATRT